MKVEDFYNTSTGLQPFILKGGEKGSENVAKKNISDAESDHTEEKVQVYSSPSILRPPMGLTNCGLILQAVL